MPPSIKVNLNGKNNSKATTKLINKRNMKVSDVVPRSKMVKSKSNLAKNNHSKKIFKLEVYALVEEESQAEEILHITEEFHFQYTYFSEFTSG